MVIDSKVVPFMVPLLAHQEVKVQVRCHVYPLWVSPDLVLLRSASFCHDDGDDDVDDYGIVLNP